jgi:hypothetical protein
VRIGVDGQSDPGLHGPARPDVIQVKPSVESIDFQYLAMLCRTFYHLFYVDVIALPPADDSASGVRNQMYEWMRKRGAHPFRSILLEALVD